MFKALPVNQSIEIHSLTPPESPTSFWVICAQDKDKVNTLRNDLHNYFKTHNISKGDRIPKVDEVRIFKDDDNVTRRVRVEFVDEIEMELRDVDTGMSIICSSDSPLYDIPSEFQKDYMGIQCRLSGIICKGDHMTWSERSLKVFRKNFQPIGMNVVGLHSNIYVVEVVVKDNKDLATILIELGVAEHLDVEDGLKNHKSINSLKKCLSRFETVEELKMPKLSMKSAAKELKLKKPYWINVNNVFTPNQFYVNFLLDSTSDELQKLESNMKEFYKERSSNKFVVNVYANLYAVDCGSTLGWKRASIVELKSGKAEIIFSDSGLTKIVSLKDLVPLDDKFSIFPAQGVCCSLGLDEFQWQKQEVEYFTRLTSKSIFEILILEKKNRRYVVEFVSLDADIKQRLMDFMKVTRENFKKLSKSDSHERSVEKGTVQSLPVSVENRTTGLPQLSARNETIQSLSIEEKVLTYPCNDTLSINDRVVVTSVESTESFYVMKMNKENKQDFLELMQDLKNHCDSAKPASSISPNTPVACKFNNMWARALVSEVDNDRIEAFFVDFGKKEEVKKEDIKVISKELIRSLPVQSFRCSLKLVQYSRDESCEFWFKDNCQKSVFLVTFAQHEIQKFVVDIKETSDNESMCQKLQRSFDDSSKKQRTSEDNSSEPLDFQELKEGCRALVVHIISPGNFYVQKQSDDVQRVLLELDVSLNKCPLVVCSNLEEGMLVAVKFEGVFYRAVVNEILNDSVRVMFVDFGNEIVIGRDSVFLGEDLIFYKSPYLAQQCYLNGWNPRIGAEVLNLFEESCLNMMFVLKNLHRDAPDLYRVELFDPETMKPAFDLQQKNMISVKENGAEHVTVDENVSEKAPGIGPDKQGTVGLPFSVGTLVSIKYSKNPFEFYLSENSDGLRNVRSRLDALGNSKVIAPSEGDVVAALYEELWARAKILKVLPDGMLRLQFLDYGFVVDVEQGEVKAISRELKDSNPTPVIHCWLSVNCNDSMERLWTKESIQWFRVNCEWKPYKLSSIRSSSVMDEEGGMIYEVELVSPEGCSMVDELLQRNIVPFKGSVPRKMFESSAKVTKRSDLGSLEAKNYRCGFISSDSPHMFWCHVVDLILEMTKEKMPAFSDNNKHKPVIGEICLAFHDEHKEWYRAEVTIVRADDAVVRLIDYEEDLVAPFTHFYPLPTHMKKYPPLAFKCSLQDVHPMGSRWTGEVNDCFSDLLIDRILNVEVVKCDGSLHLVNVITDKGVSIKDKMKETKLAK